MIFFDAFSKNNPIENLVRIRQVGAELFHEERRTDGQTNGRKDRRKEENRDRHNETNSHFRNVVNAPEDEKFYVNEFRQVFFLD